jgi:beta-lactamase superfamily II metal-dependent hydrolase
MAHARTTLLALLASWGPCALWGGELQIHVVNVGWGASVLLEGPEGYCMLLEAGRPGMGRGKVVPYLRAEGVDHLDAVVLGHNHLDHGGGLPEVGAAGYQAPVNFWNGSPGGNPVVRAWVAAVHATPMLPGDVIDLGGGATATCVAANGSILGLDGPLPVVDENDRSIALLVAYKNFTYLWESDLGGGPDDLDTCSGRRSGQMDLEVPMVAAISPGGAHPLLGPQGIDVIQVGHHGSQSSTHPLYVRMARPQVALLSTGCGQSRGWALPTREVVDRVLLSGTAGCAGVPCPLVLQTEDGDQNARGDRSTSGEAVGNIVVRTDGSLFWVTCNSDNGDVPYVVEGTLEARRLGAGIPPGTQRAFTARGGSLARPSAAGKDPR